MGTSYSPGVLDHTPLDEYDEGDEQSAIDFLLRVAAVGMSRRFREYVGERVAEFTYDGGEVAWRWLSDEEAEPILAGRLGGDTWDVNWPAAADYDVFFPNCTAAESGHVEADGLPFDGWWFESLEVAVAGVEQAVRDWESERDSDENREDVVDLLGVMRFCRDHHLILTIS